MSQLAFVTNAYRVHEDSEPSVRVNNPNARIVALDSNLDLAGATIRGRELLEGGKWIRVYEITIEALLLQDGMIGAPTRYAIWSPADGLNGEVFRAFAANLRLEAGVTVVKVRP